MDLSKKMEKSILRFPREKRSASLAGLSVQDLKIIMGISLLAKLNKKAEKFFSYNPFDRWNKKRR